MFSTPAQQNKLLTLGNDLASFVLDQSPNATFFLNEEKQIIYANNALAELFGYPLDQFPLLEVKDLFYESDQSEIRRIIKIAFNSADTQLLKPSYQLKACSKSGNVFGAELKIKSFIDKGFMYCSIQGLSTGITTNYKTKNILSRLADAIDVAHIGTWELDFTNNWLTWDDNMYKLLGITPTTYSNPFKAWDACLHPNSKDYYNKCVKEILQRSDKEFKMEFRIIQPDKSERYIVTKGVIERDESGMPLRMVGIDWDITEEKQKEEEANKLVDFQNTILNSSSYAIITCNDKDQITSFNKGAEEMLGYKAEELIGKCSPYILHDKEEFVARAKAIYDQFKIRVLPGLETIDYEVEHHMDNCDEWNLIAKDGTKIRTNLSIKKLNNADGTLRGYLAMAHDITKQKQRENEAKELLAFQNIILNSNNYAIFTKGTDGKISSFNKGAETMLGYKAEELIGIKEPKVFHIYDELIARSKELTRLFNIPISPGLNTLLFEKKVGLDKSSCYTYVKKDGSHIKVALSVSVLTNSDGSIKGHLCIARDITKQKLQEEKARELSNFQETILNSTNYAIFASDIDGVISTFNKGAEEMLGYKKAELVGIHEPSIFYDQKEVNDRVLYLNETYKADLKPGVDMFLFESKKGLDKSSCYTFKRKNGSLLTVTLSVTPLNNEDEEVRGYLAIAKDVTEEKLQEEKAKELSDFRDFIINSNNYAIFTEGIDNVFTYFSKGAEEMLGYTAEEMVGIHRPMILHDPEEFEPRAKYLSETYNTHVQPGLDSLLFESERGLDQELDWTFIRKDGGRIKVHLSVTYLKKSDGTVNGILAIARDVTQQKENALQLNKYAATLENKNKELEQFTYIASHDLQEPLRTIANFTSVINKHEVIQENEILKKYFEFISNATVRMQDLVKCLLDYSRLGRDIDFTPVDTQQILEDIVEDLRTIIKNSNAEINFENLPIIYGVKTELRLLVQNLITNAIKFKKPDVNPQINISAEFVESSWQFCIADNGIGIEEQYVKKIFMIFQRLNGVNEYEGHGIGLSHCKKIVEHHGGEIWVESKAGEGSKFFFTIANINKNS